jgi:hypothetical protein
VEPSVAKGDWVAGNMESEIGKTQEHRLLMRVFAVLAVEVIPRRYDKTVYSLFFLLFVTIIALAVSLRLR